MLPNKSVCSNSSLFDIFQPVLFGQCYGVNNQQEDDICKLAGKSVLPHFINENFNIATAMSSSRADPLLGHCLGWGHLNT